MLRRDRVTPSRHEIFATPYQMTILLDGLRSHVPTLATLLTLLLLHLLWSRLGGCNVSSGKGVVCVFFFQWSVSLLFGDTYGGTCCHRRRDDGSAGTIVLFRFARYILSRCEARFRQRRSQCSFFSPELWLFRQLATLSGAVDTVEWRNCRKSRGWYRRWESGQRDCCIKATLHNIRCVLADWTGFGSWIRFRCLCLKWWRRNRPRR